MNKTQMKTRMNDTIRKINQQREEIAMHREKREKIKAECLAHFKISELSRVCDLLLDEFADRLEVAIMADLAQGLHDENQTAAALRVELRRATAREKQWQVLAGALASAANSIYCELRVSPSTKPTPNGIDRADTLHKFILRHLPLDEEVE